MYNVYCILYTLYKLCIYTPSCSNKRINNYKHFVITIKVGTMAHIAGGIAIAGVMGAVLLGRNALYTVEGGHRSILFSRLGGLKDTVYKEG